MTYCTVGFVSELKTDRGGRKCRKHAYPTNAAFAGQCRLIHKGWGKSLPELVTMLMTLPMMMMMVVVTLCRTRVDVVRLATAQPLSLLGISSSTVAMRPSSLLSSDSSHSTSAAASSAAFCTSANPDIRAT